MRLKIDPKHRQAELELKNPKAKEGLGWFTDDRRMECEGRVEQGKEIAGRFASIRRRKNSAPRAEAERKD